MNNASNPEINVVVVEDEPYARQGFVSMLTEPGIHLLRECSTVEEGVTAICDLKPDVALIDLRLSGDDMAALGLLNRLGEAVNSVACMILTAWPIDGIMVRDILTAGARGCYRKQYMPGDRLPQAIFELAAGEVVIEPALVQDILERIGMESASSAQEVTDTLPKLSKREREILMLLNQGLQIKEAARRLHIADTTAKTHLKDARAKFGNRMNSYQLALLACVKGLLAEDTTSQN